MSNVKCHMSLDFISIIIFFYIFFQNYSVEGLLSAGSSSFLQYYLVQCNMMYDNPVQFQEDNLGTYTCQAGNRLGKAETKFIVGQYAISLPLLSNVLT